jgi:D-arabinitol 4-dehydrogenase
MTSTPTTTTKVMLHLGLGSFHRAHQALYMHQLRALGDTSWMLAGGNIRPDMAETLDALVAQNGAYTLETITPAGQRSYTCVTSIKSVIPFEPGLPRLIARAADPTTRIISFTVTEAGYYLDPHDQLEISCNDIHNDLAAARRSQSGTTLYGALVAILRQRMQAQAGPVTLLNCDNLRHNGDRFRAGLLRFIAELDDTQLLAWVKVNTTCPNAMVDRITPRPTAELIDRVRTATGWADAAPVMGESFIQWVIEDNFCAGRPQWEQVGVQMVASVAPFEEAKIRLLNATHSCVAWAGTLTGLQFIHEGMANPTIRQFAYDYATNDVIPVLSPSPIDLAAYRDMVLERFGNAAICDTNQRVAMDAYAKIPGFITPTIRERLARAESISSVAILPALFLAYLQRWHRGQIDYEYQDQAMDRAAAHAICEASDPVSAYCSDNVLWGPLANDPRLVQAIRGAYARVCGTAWHKNGGTVFN